MGMLGNLNQRCETVSAQAIYKAAEELSKGTALAAQ